MDPTNEPQDLRELLREADTRVSLVRSSHEIFFATYFPKYLKYPSAPFHRELFLRTQNLPPHLVIIAFRESAKSTIMSTSLPVWAVLGDLQKKYVLIVARTQERAREIMANIRAPFERNVRLRHDLGPFELDDGEWRNMTLVLPKYGARIKAVSIEQSVRGMIHEENRPDLIICDDVEDTESVKTKEGRDKVYNFLKAELTLAGTTGTNVVYVGNLLHADCALKRLMQEIDKGELKGAHISIPLLDLNNVCAWPGKFHNEEAIENERKRIGNDRIWRQEMLLQIVPDGERLVREEWLKTYDELPQAGDVEFVDIAIGIDLAMSDKESADFTAMVVGIAYWVHGEIRIYILGPIIRAHLSPLDSLDSAKSLSVTHAKNDCSPTLVVENVNQGLFVQMLEQRGCIVEPVRPTSDKRTRLATVVPYLQAGKVFLPQAGAEDLRRELLDFGFDRHDDVADAFVHLLSHFIQYDHAPPICSIPFGPTNVLGGWRRQFYGI